VNEFGPFGSIWFSVGDAGGGGGGGVVLGDGDVDVVVVVVLVVLAGPFSPPPHAVIVPIAAIATAPARRGNRRCPGVNLISQSYFLRLISRLASVRGIPGYPRPHQIA
jgi:hypothetical protein